jgi:hypothetical protein
MKKLIFFVLFAISSQATFAQEAIQKVTNMPRSSDILVKQQVVYMNPGKSGKDILWDFSGLRFINQSYSVCYNSFPNNPQLIAGTEHQTRYYYVLSNDSLLVTGYENPTTIMKYDQPKLFLRFPMLYGDSINCFFNGKGRYCENLDITSYGSSFTIADATGRMILPNGDTLQHVVRIHCKEILLDKSKALGSPISSDDSVDSVFNSFCKFPSVRADSDILSIDSYKWYASGYRYPILETISTSNIHGNSITPCFSTAFYYPPEFHNYLTNDELNRKILDKLKRDKGSLQTQGKDDINIDLEESFFRYRCYPNPVLNMLTLNLFLKCDAIFSYNLYDMQGKLYQHTDPHQLISNSYSLNIDMSNCLSGLYILEIRINDKLYSEKIIKK